MIKTKNQTRVRAASLLCLSLLLFAGCRGSSPPPAGGSGGWTLGNGQRSQLADYKGKVVVLDFYATWCQPCREETPHLVQLDQRYRQKGLEVIGLNVGGADDHQQVPDYAREFGIQFPLAIPDDDLVDEYLGLNQNIPQTFVVDRDGRIVKRFVGYSSDAAADLEQIIQEALTRNPKYKT